MSPSLGVYSNGSWARYSFNYPNASSHSAVHSIFLPFPIIWKKEWHLSVVLEMNRFRATSFPVRLYTSLISRGDLIYVIAHIFFGLASIPRWLTMNPKNFPEHTPNAHFSGLSFIIYLFSNSKVSSKCSICSASSSDFVIMSSTYIYIVRLIIYLPIFDMWPLYFLDRMALPCNKINPC